MSSTVRVEESGGVVVATLPLEIDLSNVRDVRAQLFDSLRPTVVALVIDLSHSTYLDSKGIYLLMELEQYLEQTRRPFRLVVSPRDPLARLLETAGVPIRRHETVDQALQDILMTTSGSSTSHPESRDVLDKDLAESGQS